MTDTRPPVSGASTTGVVVVVLILVGFCAPAALWFVSGIQIAPFFGDYPTAAEVAAQTPWTWLGFGIALLTAAFVVVTTVRRGGRMPRAWLAALVVLAVVAVLDAGAWGAIAVGRQAYVAELSRSAAHRA